jgi:hypothetical protein
MATPRRISITGTILLAVLLVAGVVVAQGIDFPPADFTILNADGSQVVGHSKYTVATSNGGVQVVMGEDRYLNGEYDIERDRLEMREPSQTPVMLSSEHTFYRRDGSVERLNRADFRSGEASCLHHERGKEVIASDKLQFPPNTFAGPVVVLPLQQFLQTGGRGAMELYVFNCVPGPKIFKVKAEPKIAAPWAHYPGKVVQVDVTPDFGWLNIIIAPFVPQIHAWFDPSWNLHFVGGEFSRFYRGPQIILARAPSDSARRADADNEAPAAGAAAAAMAGEADSHPTGASPTTASR